MKIEPSKRKQPAKSGKRIYTYMVTCSFRLQYSFVESEVEQDPGGDEGELQPTDKALRVLEKDLTEILGQDYCVTDLQAKAESDQFLGTTEE
jgi:hypothetical protein